MMQHDDMNPGDLTAYLQQEGRRRAAELAAARPTNASPALDATQRGQIQSGTDPVKRPLRSLSEALRRMGIRTASTEATPHAGKL